MPWESRRLLIFLPLDSLFLISLEILFYYFINNIQETNRQQETHARRDERTVISKLISKFISKFGDARSTFPISYPKWYNIMIMGK